MELDLRLPKKLRYSMFPINWMIQQAIRILVAWQRITEIVEWMSDYDHGFLYDVNFISMHNWYK